MQVRPQLQDPALILAFEGWNDASDAASGVAAYLLGQHDVTEPFASIEPEEFYDFQEHRPTVEVDQGGTRRLTWPATRAYALEMVTQPADIVVVTGSRRAYLRAGWARLRRRLPGESDARFAQGREIPAVTHVDGSARLQTLARHTHPEFYDLLARFDQRTGCPVLINTSFNVRGEPIVCTPDDAIATFLGSGMDTLVLGHCLVRGSRYNGTGITASESRRPAPAAAC